MFFTNTVSSWVSWGTQYLCPRRERSERGQESLCKRILKLTPLILLAHPAQSAPVYWRDDKTDPRGPSTFTSINYFGVSSGLYVNHTIPDAFNTALGRLSDERLSRLVGVDATTQDFPLPPTTITPMHVRQVDHLPRGDQQIYGEGGGSDRQPFVMRFPRGITPKSALHSILHSSNRCLILLKVDTVELSLAHAIYNLYRATMASNPALVMRKVKSLPDDSALQVYGESAPCEELPTALTQSPLKVRILGSRFVTSTITGATVVEAVRKAFAEIFFARATAPCFQILRVEIDAMERISYAEATNLFAQMKHSMHPAIVMRGAHPVDPTSDLQPLVGLNMEGFYCD